MNKSLELICISWPRRGMDMHAKNFGLWDARGESWLGNAEGPWKNSDWEIARAAATIASEQLGRYVLPKPFPESPVRLKDEVATRCTPTEAIQLIEARAT